MKNLKQYYNWYMNQILNKGLSPTITEMGKHFDFTREYARLVMMELAMEGYIVKLSNRKWRDCYALRIGPLIEYIKNNG